MQRFTKVKVKVHAAEGEEVTFKYYGGVDRREDIDLFKLYQDYEMGMKRRGKSEEIK